ncbi:hypothetical protein [Hyunsoonleella ulvae]|nr:hypothetical protein [Hyunsoonleella ulvae]
MENVLGGKKGKTKDSNKTTANILLMNQRILSTKLVFAIVIDD